MKKLSVLILILFCGLMATYGQSKSPQKKSSSSHTTKSVTANGLSPKSTALLSDLVLLNRPLTIQDVDLMQKYGMELIEGYLCVPVIATLKDSISVDSLIELNFPVELQNGQNVLVNVPVMSYVDFARCGLFEYLQLKSEGSLNNMKGISQDVFENIDSTYKQQAFDEMIERLKSIWFS